MLPIKRLVFGVRAPVKWGTCCAGLLLVLCLHQSNYYAPYNLQRALVSHWEIGGSKRWGVISRRRPSRARLFCGRGNGGPLRDSISCVDRRIPEDCAQCTAPVLRSAGCAGAPFPLPILACRLTRLPYRNTDERENQARAQKYLPVIYAVRARSRISRHESNRTTSNTVVFHSIARKFWGWRTNSEEILDVLV
jgi:hypothetical protein